ncbi:MAG TPA: CerR family C-terminal domain-containing protein [Verrucomicrobiae bacterium]|jgi:AcrR family transcriptional regulator|nr:CerR family C-terminal domain-containing protein [Verrucomicrobiae bacterium]
MGIRPAIPDHATHAATREHLLEAAGEVFAEVGFRAATVRQICQRAGANIAAVNYHFGDKTELYRAVLKESSRAALAKYPPDFGLPPRATPEQRLRAFVYSFLLRIFSEGPSARHGKLMAREMIEPTGALDSIVKDNIRPSSVLLMSIIGDLIGKKASDKTKRLCAMSVVSQVLFYHHCRPVVLRLFPGIKFDEANTVALADHITSFSLAALKQIAKSPKTK